MKLAMLVIVAACQPGGGGDDYPLGPGGPGGPIGMNPGSGGGGDAGAGDGGDGGDGGVTLAGRVCLLTDLRRIGDPTVCAGDGAGDLKVSLDTREAITSGDGSFRIAPPRGGGFTWRVVNGRIENIVTSLMPFGADHLIPAVTTDTYADLVVGNGMRPADEQGSIVLRIVRDAADVSGGTAAVPVNVAINETRYDGRQLDDWTNTTATGAAGTMWLNGVALAVSPAIVPVTVAQGTTSLVVNVPVENQAITFMIKELP